MPKKWLSSSPVLKWINSLSAYLYKLSLLSTWSVGRSIGTTVVGKITLRWVLRLLFQVIHFMKEIEAKTAMLPSQSYYFATMISISFQWNMTIISNNRCLNYVMVIHLRYGNYWRLLYLCPLQECKSSQYQLVLPQNYQFCCLLEVAAWSCSTISCVTL